MTHDHVISFLCAGIHYQHYCISHLPQVPLPLIDLQTLIEQCTRELQCSSVYGVGSSRSRSSGSGRTDSEQTDLGTSDDVV